MPDFVVLPAPAAKPQESRLGYGITRPFRRDARSGFAAAGGITLAQARLGQLLATKRQTGARGGELPWRGQFGSRLHLLRYRNNTALLVALARTYVEEAVADWEPNLRITSVDVETARDGVARTIIVHVRFRPILANGTIADEEAIALGAAA